MCVGVCLVGWESLESLCRLLDLFHWHFDPMALRDTLAAVVQGCCQDFSGCVL